MGVVYKQFSSKDSDTERVGVIINHTFKPFSKVHQPEFWQLTLGSFYNVWNLLAEKKRLLISNTGMATYVVVRSEQFLLLVISYFIRLLGQKND